MEKDLKKPLRSSYIYAKVATMELDLKYRGRVATTEDVELINALMAASPDDSRRKLSVKFCRQTNWTQPNGSLKDMVARSYMLMLHRAGHITLPPKKIDPPNPLSKRKKPTKVETDKTPVNTKLKKILPIEFLQVRRSKREKLFNSLIDSYHYLGYTQPVGEHLKYIVYAKDKPLACLAYSSAPRHIGPRDAFIGWDQKTLKKNISLICYNTRFLILPWVKVPYLASHILSRAAKILPGEWDKIYNHPVYYIETFVDKDKFAGTCYKAANWIYLGDTKGLGKASQTKIPDRSIKAIYGYPLVRNFRKILGAIN